MVFPFGCCGGGLFRSTWLGSFLGGAGLHNVLSFHEMSRFQYIRALIVRKDPVGTPQPRHYSGDSTANSAAVSGELACTEDRLDPCASGGSNIGFLLEFCPRMLDIVLTLFFLVIPFMKRSSAPSLVSSENLSPCN